jgi:hypothetical protein
LLILELELLHFPNGRNIDWNHGSPSLDDDDVDVVDVDDAVKHCLQKTG